METTEIQKALDDTRRQLYTYKICGIFKTPVRNTSWEDANED